MDTLISEPDYSLMPREDAIIAAKNLFHFTRSCAEFYISFCLGEIESDEVIAKPENCTNSNLLVKML